MINELASRTEVSVDGYFIRECLCVCVYENIIIIQETHFDWNRIAVDAQENEIHHVCEPEQWASCNNIHKCSQIADFGTDKFRNILVIKRAFQMKMGRIYGERTAWAAALRAAVKACIKPASSPNQSILYNFPSSVSLRHANWCKKKKHTMSVKANEPNSLRQKSHSIHKMRIKFCLAIIIRTYICQNVHHRFFCCCCLHCQSHLVGWDWLCNSTISVTFPAALVWLWTFSIRLEGRRHECYERFWMCVCFYPFDLIWFDLITVPLSLWSWTKWTMYNSVFASATYHQTHIV